MSGKLATVGHDDRVTQAGPALCAPEGFAAIEGSCASDVSLAPLDEAAACRMMVGQTARFTASFMRWMEGRTCDGLSHTRLRLLETLHSGGPAIMRDLAAQLGATPRNMTAMVDALEEAGLVVRRPHPTDRRATLIELSPAGAREVAQEMGPRLDAMSEIFDDLSQTEREQFSGLLAKLMRAIKDRLPQC